MGVSCTLTKLKHSKKHEFQMVPNKLRNIQNGDSYPLHGYAHLSNPDPEWAKVSLVV